MWEIQIRRIRYSGQRQSDNSGNTAITQKWVESGDISTATNRYGTGVTYDVAGNITADARFRNLTYGYDANGRQNYTAAADGSGPVTAIFDGAGQRVAKKAGGVLSIMVYDAGGKLVAEYGATAPTTANLQYVTADYQGSTRVVTNSSGAIANRRDYLPFGEEIGATVGSRTPGKGFGQGDAARQKYAGMETDDATAMAHTLWRKQDNLSGRWTSPDPYGGSMTIADPQSFNRYTYVNNDPVNLVDPTGLALSDIGVYQTDNPAVANALGNEMARRISSIVKQSQQAKQQELPPPARLPSTIGQPYTPDGSGTPPATTGPIVVDIGPPPPPPLPRDDCKQDPNGGDRPEIQTYLWRAGLLNPLSPSASFIDPSSIVVSKEGITYNIPNVIEFNAALRNSPYRVDLNNGPPLNGEHDSQVGGEGVDSRFRTGTIPDKLGPKGLQVVVGPVNKSGGAIGYSDLDCSNPAQSFRSAFRHLFRR